MLGACGARCSLIVDPHKLLQRTTASRAQRCVTRARAMSSSGHDATKSDSCQPTEEGAAGLGNSASVIPDRKATCDAEQFVALDLRAGTISTAKLNPKARQPAYVLGIDLGPLGTVTSSAQLVANYSVEDLIGRRVVVVANLPPRKIAGVKSEVLVLGTMSSAQGTLLLSPDDRAANGAPVG